MWTPLDTQPSATHCCWSSAPIHGSGTSQWCQWSPPVGQCALSHHKNAQEQLEEQNKTPRRWPELQTPRMPIWSGHAGTSAIQGGPTPKHTDTTNVLVPDTTGHPHRYYDQSFFGCTRGTCILLCCGWIGVFSHKSAKVQKPKSLWFMWHLLSLPPSSCQYYQNQR